jgi:hypothetical protein
MRSERHISSLDVEVLVSDVFLARFSKGLLLGQRALRRLYPRMFRLKRILECFLLGGLYLVVEVVVPSAHVVAREEHVSHDTRLDREFI